LLHAAPYGGTRILVNVTIVGFLATQVAVPASYYLFEDEPTQERFCWRMFSSVDLSTWDGQFTEQVDVDGCPAERVVLMERFLQETHCGLVRKVQLEVIEKFMRTRLRDPRVQTVMFEARGTAPSGKPLGPVKFLLERADGFFCRIQP
jgi:hypothetical protein